MPGSGWQSAWNASLPASKAALLERVGCDSSFQTWTDTATTEEQIPMNCVDWFTAFAFCAWDGGRLPTEVEWEYAATGGSEDRLYPWGSADPSLLENEGLASDIYSDNSPFIPAGSHPSGNGRWGHRDLAGSLWEWTFDGYAAYTTAACDDCARVAASAKRVLRGGYWYNYKEYLPAAYRGAAPPTTLDSGYGFRCARSL